MACDLRVEPSVAVADQHAAYAADGNGRAQCATEIQHTRVERAGVPGRDGRDVPRRSGDDGRRTATAVVVLIMRVQLDASGSCAIPHAIPLEADIDEFNARLV